MTVSLGIALPSEAPVRELVAIARQAEADGCSFIWVHDDRLQKDPFGVLAAIALATDRVLVGPGVTNPFTRHPALLASAIATLDELSGGRAVLGLGAGGTNHRMLGIERRAPVATLRGAIELIRALLHGERVSVAAPGFDAHEAVLDFAPRRGEVPIHLGARGPRMLELAGELADAVIVGNLATVGGWNYARERVLAGAARRGRDRGEVGFTAWFYCALADDPVSAHDAIRPMVATSLVTSRHILGDLGLELPQRFAEVMAAHDWIPSAEAVRAAGAVLPEAALEWFGLAGTPAECRGRLGRLLHELPEITQVAIVPAVPAGSSAAEVVRRFLTEVAPASGRAAGGHGNVKLRLGGG